MVTMAQTPTLWLRFLLSSVLCGTVAMGFLARRAEAPTRTAPGTAAGARAGQEPSSLPPETGAGPAPNLSWGGPVGDFPVAAARRLHGLLVGAGGAAITRQGRVVRGEQIAAEDWHLLDPEPRSFGPRWMALPEYREVLAWVVRGGDLERLPHGQRSELEQVDAAFLESGLLPPFEPYLEARPGAGGSLEEAMWGELRVRHFVAGPWAWSAGEAFREALEFTQRFEAGLARDPGETLGLPGFSAPHFLDRLGAHGILIAFMARERPRIAVAQAVRPGVRAYRRALVSAARSLRREPETAEMHAVLFSRAATRAAPLHYSELSHMTTEQLLGLEPRSPAELLLAGDVLREAEFGRVARGEEQRAVLERIQTLYRLAAAESADDRRSRARARRARSRLVEVSTRLGDHAALASLIDEFARVLRRRPPAFGIDALEGLAGVVVDAPPEVAAHYTRRHRRVLLEALERLLVVRPELASRGRIEGWAAQFKQQAAGK